MAEQIKVSVLEQNGEEYSFPVEMEASDLLKKIEKLPIQPMQFIFVGSVSYSRYLHSHSYPGSGGLLGSVLPSGDSSNGFRYSNCSPIQSCVTGKIIGASLAVKGMAVSTGSVGTSLRLRLQLFEIGFNSEGISKGYIDFTFPSSGKVVGTYNNDSVNSNFVMSIQDLDISIEAGKLYGLKFINASGNSNISEVTNISVVLEATKQ